MKLFRRKRKNNQGFSLVEVICAIAIMGLVSTAVGSAMIVTTTNYQRGSAEVDVQKEAQATTNLIGNLLVDAVQVTSSTVGDLTTVTIDGEGITYNLEYNATDDTIKYKETVAAGTPIDGVLAENVTDFKISVDNDNRNAKIELAIEKNGKNYEATYNTNSRNGKSVNTGATPDAKIIMETKVTLEPGQGYSFPVTILGATVTGLTWSGFTTGSDSEVGGTTISGDLTTGTINVGNDAKGTLYFTVETVERDPVDASLAMDSVQVEVNIRSVESVSSGARLLSGTAYKKDAVYRIDASALGANFDKVYGKDFDQDYRNPRYIDFTYSMTDKTTGAAYDVNTYIEKLSNITAEDTDSPYIDIKLKEDMPINSVISVVSVPKHTRGAWEGAQYNKTNNAYDAALTGLAEITNDQPNITMGNGLKRGQDFLDFGHHFGDLNEYKTAFGGEPTWLFRYRAVEAGATWSQYYTTAEGGSQQKINALETYLWDPTKDYEYEMMLAFIDWDESGNNHKLCWPHDATLFEAGKGFTEYNVTQGWDADDLAHTLSTSNSSVYSAKFILEKAEMAYKATNSGESVDIGIAADALANNVGSMEQPIVLSKSTSPNWLYAGFDVDHLFKGHYNHYEGKFQKYNPSANGGMGAWEDISISGKFSFQGGGGSDAVFKITNIQSGAEVGRYRMVARMQQEKVGTISPQLKGWTISVTTPNPVEYWEFGYGNDSGYIYFNIVD